MAEARLGEDFDVIDESQLDMEFEAFEKKNKNIVPLTLEDIAEIVTEIKNDEVFPSNLLTEMKYLRNEVRSKILKKCQKIYGRSRTNENDVTTPQGNDDSGAPKQSVRVNLQEKQSDVTEPLLSVGEMQAPKQEVNVQEQKSDVTEPLLLVEKLEVSKQELLECIQRLKSIETHAELDQHGKEILRVLQEGQKYILENDPNILNVLIQKACQLIDSEFYEDIIKVAPHGSQDSPLKHLLELMHDAKCLEKLMHNQNKLLSVIKKITTYGDVQFRTQCLRFLIFTSESQKDTSVKFRWSTELLSTLRDLLDNGADPTWFPTGALKKKRGHRYTAQDAFFLQIITILWEENELYEAILQVLPQMLSEKCTDTKPLRGTILHAFIEPFWDYLALGQKIMPSNFYHQFRIILKEILKHDKTLVVKQDRSGRTPLLVFLEGIKLSESNFSDVAEIIQLLQSPANLSARNDVLHYLAIEFPVFQELITKKKIQSFLELVMSWTGSSNVCSQDKLIQSALHLLVHNQNKSELFVDFVKIFQTPSNIKQAERQTALQILVQQYHSKVSESGVTLFLDTVKCLNTHSDTSIPDSEGSTVLHTIATSFERNMPLHILNIFFQLLQIIASKSNVSFQDKKGQTALHILARKFPSEISEQSRVAYQNAVRHLATYDILEMKDCQGLTALHILVGNFAFEMPDYAWETFLEVLKCSAFPNITCIQDPNGHTALQIISKANENKVPKHCKEKFQKLSLILNTHV